MTSWEVSYISVIVNQHGSYGVLLSLTSKCFVFGDMKETDKLKKQKKDLEVFLCLPMLLNIPFMLLPISWNKLYCVFEDTSLCMEQKLAWVSCTAFGHFSLKWVNHWFSCCSINMAWYVWSYVVCLNKKYKLIVQHKKTSFTLC